MFRFTAGLDARIYQCDNGEKLEYANRDGTLRHYAALCREFCERVREGRRAIFYGQAAFDPEVERLWRDEAVELYRRENLLVFGKVGSGKTHLLCVLAQERVQARRRLLFTTSSRLVQELLLAKRDLKLKAVLKRLAAYEGLLIDNLGYAQQSREEMEVLFTLLADRYERGSVWLTIVADHATYVLDTNRFIQAHQTC